MQTRIYYNKDVRFRIYPTVFEFNIRLRIFTLWLQRSINHFTLRPTAYLFLSRKVLIVVFPIHIYTLNKHQLCSTTVSKFHTHKKTLLYSKKCEWGPQVWPEKPQIDP